MTTPLLEPVTRRTTYVVDERPVEVTLATDALIIHLVGQHEKNDRRLPLDYLIRAAGHTLKVNGKTECALGSEELKVLVSLVNQVAQNRGRAA